MYIYIYIYTCVYIYIHVYIYIYTWWFGPLKVSFSMGWRLAISSPTATRCAKHSDETPCEVNQILESMGATQYGVGTATLEAQVTSSGRVHCADGHKQSSSPYLQTATWPGQVFK